MGKKNRKKTTWRKLSLNDESATDSSDVKDSNKNADVDPCNCSNNRTARLHSMSAKKPFLSSRKYRQYPPYYAADTSGVLTGQTADDAASNLYSASEENGYGDEQLYFQPFVYPCFITPTFVVPPYHPSQWYEDPRLPYDTQNYICLTQPLSPQPPQNTSSIQSCSSPDTGSDVGYSSSSPPASNRTSEEVQLEDSAVNYSDGFLDETYAYSQQQSYYHDVAGALPEDQPSSSSSCFYPGTTYVLKPVALIPHPPPSHQEWWDSDYGGGGIGRRRRRRGFIGGEGITYDRWPSRIAKDPHKSEQHNKMQEDIGDEVLDSRLETSHNTQYFKSSDQNVVPNVFTSSQNQVTSVSNTESELVHYLNPEDVSESTLIEESKLALTEIEENLSVEIEENQSVEIEENQSVEILIEDVPFDQVENEPKNSDSLESETKLVSGFDEENSSISVENVTPVIECSTNSAECEESTTQIGAIDLIFEESSTNNANEVSSTTNIEDTTPVHSFTPTDTWSSACQDPLRYSKYYQICGVDDDEIINEEEKVEDKPEELNVESDAKLELMPCIDEIVVHEVDDCANRSDAPSECGSEDVEMIGHRYESGAEKLYKPCTVSLAAELLDTNQPLPCDQNLKHLMERSKRVTLTTTTGYLSNTRNVMESYCSHLAIRHQGARLGVVCDGTNGSRDARPRSDGLDDDDDDIDVADAAEEEIIFRRSSTEANVFQPQTVPRRHNGFSPFFYLRNKRSWHGCCCSIM